MNRQLENFVEGLAGISHQVPRVLMPCYEAGMQILCGIISFVVALAGIWTSNQLS
jgi:hypothetical protein